MNLLLVTPAPIHTRNVPAVARIVDGQVFRAVGSLSIYHAHIRADAVPHSDKWHENDNREYT